jgi:glycosyltransferase involved in cell wall biosynthesis
MSQRVLIIAYYWPPAGGPGVQRWLGFAQHLPALGYEVTVVVPENAHYPVRDESLLASVPQVVTVLRVPIKEPSRLASSLLRKRTNQLQKGIINKKPSPLQDVLLWLRGNFFIPDARVGWKPAVLIALQDYCAVNKPLTLITTGPPHSVHCIGAAIKKTYNSINWLADFRDPWTTIGYHKDLKLTRWATQKHNRLEQEILDSCDALIVTSPHTAAEFEAKTNTSVHVVTNGYDIVVNTSNEQPAGAFTIAHIGTLLADRNPKVLWEVLRKLLQNLPDFKDHFKLVLVGNIAAEISASIASYGLSDYVEYTGYVAHDKAVEIMLSSQLLLLVEINTAANKAIIAGKIFEYLASRRPIIAIGPVGAAIATVINQNDAGVFFLYSDTTILYEHIHARFTAYKKNQNSAVTGTTVAAYSRKSLTNSLSAIIQMPWE